MSFKRILVSVLAVVLCAAMCLSFIACGDNNNTTDETSADQSEVTTAGSTDDKKQTVTETRVVNDTKTLILQENTFDGVFNPFFYSNAYDGDVIGLCNVGLLSMDPTGAVVAGDNYDTVAKSYSIYYTNDLTNYTAKETYEEGDYVVYEMVIKNGCKFSDGSAITADDVLFNYYVYLDPAYVGSSTLYTLPILGMTDYRTQVAGSDTYGAVAAKIFAAGEGEYKTTDEYTKEQYDAYWAGLNKVGLDFANEIVNYVEAEYKSSEYSAGGSKYSGKKAIDFSVAGEKIAFGMAMWGFGSFDSNTTYTEDAKGTKGLVGEDYKTLYTATEDADAAKFEADGKMYTSATDKTETADCVYIVSSEETEAGYVYTVAAFEGTRYKANTEYDGNFTAACTGKKYTMTGNDMPTVADYWENLRLGYSDDNGVVDFQTLSDTESAGMDLISKASESFILAYANVGSVKSIAGLVKGEKTIDGVKYETVKMILTEQNPKAILSVGVTVAPKAYYTAGYKYADGAVVNAGVELGINGNSKFMDHLAKLNSAPMGAGTYKFVKFENGDVTLVRNDYHETMGDGTVYNANIKNVYMKVIESGKEFDALKAGDVHYATVSASADAVAEIATLNNLTSILVDNLGYGYICINPTCAEYGLNNLYTRIAYTSVLDLAKVNDYYPNGLADVIYRAQSQVSWAYPEGAKAIYAFDDTLATAKEYFKKAGYTLGNDGKFTDVPAMDFYLPSSAEDHPAGAIFLKAQELLATIGVTANIKVDENLIANIKKGNVPCYALAWSSAADPDMYQVYHYKSAAESVISNGIQWLEANGGKNELGTVEVVKLDGSKVEMNQKQALDYLGELIEQGVKYMSAEERKPIYNKALEVLAQLSIEIPTYQRKNMFAYDNTMISATTLSTTITPYWGPIAEIWKLSFADGVEGNTSVEVTYEVTK